MIGTTKIDFPKKSIQFPFHHPVTLSHFALSNLKEQALRYDPSLTTSLCSLKNKDQNSVSVLLLAMGCAAPAWR
jgi:hypothetical protein